MSIRINISRELIVRHLRSHGEDQVANRAAEMTDDEHERIGRCAGDWSVRPGVEPLARAVAQAAVEVLEGAPRELRLKRRSFKAL